jgi:two-component system, sensor histidine kinase and response regulator
MSVILIVDDNPNNLQLASSILKEQGVSVLVAQDGGTAVSISSREMPDLILMDIMMPGTDGIEACRLIKSDKRTADIPVIFLTALSQADDIVRGFEAGGADYVSKPFNRSELAARVNCHLEIARQRREIQQMVNARDKLYSMIAHDIRAPFAGIVQVIEAISEGYIDPRSDDFYEISQSLKESSVSTLSLLSNLLEWARTQSGQMAANISTVNISAMLEDCAAAQEAAALSKGIAIYRDIEKNLLAICDDFLINSAVRNLLSNSLKFTPKGGTVTLGAKLVGGQLIIKVTDTGVGISNEMLAKISSGAERITTPGTNNESGTGFGLMLTRDLVALSNGELSISSQPGKGTSASIKLQAGQ